MMMMTSKTLLFQLPPTGKPYSRHLPLIKWQLCATGTL